MVRDAPRNRVHAVSSPGGHRAYGRSLAQCQRPAAGQFQKVPHNSKDKTGDNMGGGA